MLIHTMEYSTIINMMRWTSMCNDINVHNRVLGGEKKDVY